MSRHVGARRSVSSCGEPRQGRRVESSRVKFRYGQAWNGEFRHGRARQARRGKVRQGKARYGRAGMALRVRARRGADCRGMAGKASLVGLWSDPVRQGAECPPKIWHGRVGQGRQGGSCRGQSRCVTVRFVGTRYGKAGMVSNKTNRITTRKEYL